MVGLQLQNRPMLSYNSRPI